MTSVGGNSVQDSHLEAWVPRGLLTIPANVLEGRATAEGLCPMRIHWQAGRLHRVELIAIDASSPPQHVLLPRLVEPHAHLDKAFTWADFPNLSGSYSGALAANLLEHQQRTLLGVRQRAERALQLALQHGLRAVRSHVDSVGPHCDLSWEALLDLQRQWQDRLTLQLVALVPVEHWSTSAGKKLAQKVAASGGLMGGVLVPPCNGPAPRHALRKMLLLADQLGCAIDLHIDEANSHYATGVQQLLRVLDGIKVSVPITCSHASTLGLLPPAELCRIAERMADHQINVVALPMTNGWLLAKQPRRTPVERPIAPIHQLQVAGISVAVGGDNVQDPWFPAGNFDPLSLMAFSLPLAHLAPWQRLGLAPFTTAAAHLMDLAWDGTLQPGSPADLILVKASSWAELLAAKPDRRVLINGTWLDEQTMATTTST
ncbi:MAG: amidohydrolase family protein [Prochlorococcus sp.]|nr:amidohydrolase family protein [Prochlorococcaceae cyanobacterium ETNP18_MAG_1]